MGVEMKGLLAFAALPKMKGVKKGRKAYDNGGNPGGGHAFRVRKASGFVMRSACHIAPIDERRSDDDAKKNVVIGAHFFSPFTGSESPWNHAPMKIVTPPARHPACQSGRKKAVAISATPSMAKMFDQYLSITPPLRNHTPHLPACRTLSGAGRGCNRTQRKPSAKRGKV